MRNKKVELIYFRAFICMLIILTHVFTELMRSIDGTDINQLKLIYYVQNIFIFGTPSFIILAQLLVTLNYKKLSINYLWSRFKYIFIPYLMVGMFYCYTESLKLDSPFTHQFYENIILGKWYGYFIIVIMQYFILSYLIYKISYKIFNSKIILFTSLIVQVVFLHLLENNKDFARVFHSIYPLSDNTFILGWIFFLGGYIGLNYNKIINFLNKYIFIIIGLSVISYIIFVLFKKHDYWYVTSYTDYLVLYHTFMFLLLLGICLQFKSFMFYSINLTSTFSFFIFLFHPMILSYVYEYTLVYKAQTILFIVLTMLFVLGLCVGVGVFLREFYIFRFVIGKQPYRTKFDLKEVVSE
ncbi:intercellular adhesion protein C [Staphylococcus piscifermentans]|uniref:Probable poly-beta-1,6-N-acetyl-D-glucosamine export protein n=3 Tax=Staphylococcus piscifermentans TaxID=70258 RepID=A0A239TFX6_9STAP|nr:polysaccharide intercellular adhesin biosynthesis/export protein IcaC [Staphylococcus piscifermentans]GEP85096.1 putative poly-beta-1,6-N-acetyl-D-glucosamine export protein [Staphylococcus piscifermentans]SNU95723.1 intercellular adhesion protein C [Staphylococcus piscifermentans]